MEAHNKVRSNEFNLEHLGAGGDQQTYIQIIGEPSERAPLFAKLVKLNSLVKKLKHTGNYAAGNTKYTYATEADVIEPIAEALAQVGIATVPSVVEQWWQDLPGKYGTNRVCTVHAQLVLADSETGAYIVAHTYSTAANGDKASNAAFTTAIKYLLAKLALVAFGDDADEYTLEGEKASAVKSRAKKTTPTVSSEKLEALTKRINETGAGDAVKKHLKENKLAWSKLTERDLHAINELVNSVQMENEAMF